MDDSVKRRNLSLIVALGTLGAVLLVLSATFITPGKFILIPYAALLLAIAVVLRGQGIRSYTSRFLVAFGAFMIATIALYVALLFSSGGAASITLLGHTWRLALVAGIGIAINAALARVAEPA